MELDAIGLKCPMPIVRLSQAVKAATVGEEIVVLADDPAFGPDIQAWAEKTGHVLISIDKSNPARMRAVIKKAHA